MINTLSGSIPVESMGFTLMHEHLFCSDWAKRMCYPGYCNPDEAVKKISQVVIRAKTCGVDTIVDVTPINLGRDIKILTDVAKQTGMKIVACTGLYATEDKWIERISEDGLLYLYLKDINEGMQGTEYKAGVIKCATDEPGFTNINQKMLRCAARAQRESGLPLITHCRPAGREYGLRQQEIFKQEGADLTKVVIGHFRKGDSLDYAEQVLHQGSYLGIDQMNWQERNLEHNIEVIKQLISRGWTSKLILSHDAVVCYNYEHWEFKNTDEYVDFAPNMLSYLKETAWSKMLCAGIPETALDMIFYENPKRLFS